MVKNPPANAGDSRDTDSILGLGKSPGVENSNMLLYSCLENSMYRGAWWAAVHRVPQTEQLSMHSQCQNTKYDNSVTCALHPAPPDTCKNHSTHPKGPTATWQQKPPHSAENGLSGLHQKPQESAIGLCLPGSPVYSMAGKLIVREMDRKCCQ